MHNDHEMKLDMVRFVFHCTIKFQESNVLLQLYECQNEFQFQWDVSWCVLSQ